MDTTRRNKDFFRFLALASTLMVFAMIVLGGIVRASGLSCPDWPTCMGGWLPPVGTLSLLAYVHRLLVLATYPLFAATMVSAWRQHRKVGLIIWPLAAAIVLLALQAMLGRLVLGEQTADLVAVHFGIALLTLGLSAIATVMAFVRYLNPEQPDRLAFRSPFARLSLAGLAGLFVVLVSGVFVSAADASLICTSWPLCDGGLIPTSSLALINMGHQLLVGGGGILMIVLLTRAWRTQRSQRAILSVATLTVVLYFMQFFIGALKMSRIYPAYLLGLHSATGAAVWGTGVVLTVLVGLAARSWDEEVTEAAIPINGPQRARDLLGLTKPIIVALLLVTTYAGMVVAAKQLPSLALTFWTLLGGALAAGGSGAVNQYIDRELDQRMTRTAKRPIASGRMTAAEGLAFGLALLVVSFYVYAGFVNLLAAMLALTGMLYYIVLYSLWLKHATVQNIVIGGGAGAIPPMVGWAAATGSLAIPALFLFAIIFMWTPPHFWALALVRQNDYARAGVPMLPVVRGERVTRWQILLYTLELVGLTLLFPILGMAGSAFLIAALVLGFLLIYVAWQVWRVGGNKIAWQMYRYSSMYLALLFAALVVDALL
ncbi:MAG: heme o synthase [Chloroflexi bacterium]|nr:heme o synthase [Chloroflexota bacterium]